MELSANHPRKGPGPTFCPVKEEPPENLGWVRILIWVEITWWVSHVLKVCALYVIVITQ